MKTKISYSFAAATMACGLAQAQTTAYTTPVGYLSQTCLANSDTIVGAPLRQPTVSAAALTSAPIVGPSAAPVLTASQALLTVSGAAFGSYGGTHYVKFTSGLNSGAIFPIDANDATTLTIDLNGLTLSAVSNDKFSVTKFWTLDDLFNPAVSTSDPTTTGNAIVVSPTGSGGNRRTEVLFSDLNTADVDLAASATYFIQGNAVPVQWRQQGGDGSNVGSTQIWPDTYFTIRHRASVLSNTTFTCSGEVDTVNSIIPLFTRVGGLNEKRDNPRLITRPVDVTLDSLNLAQTPAFITSPTASGGNRRDELLVYDNTAVGNDKSAFKTYFFLGNSTPPQWRQQGGDGSNVGSQVIKAGEGFVIRKFGTATGETVFWNNTPTY